MQQQLAVARSVVTRVAMGHDAAARDTVAIAEAVAEAVSGASGAGPRADHRASVMDGKQNDNEVGLGIEAMHPRAANVAQIRMTASEWPVSAETGAQIARMPGQGGRVGAADAIVFAVPACALGMAGGLALGIVPITSFANRTIVRGAPGACVDVLVIGAGIVSGEDALATGSAIGRDAGTAHVRPARHAAWPGRTTRRPHHRGAVRAIFSGSVQVARTHARRWPMRVQARSCGTRRIPTSGCLTTSRRLGSTSSTS